MNISKNAAEVLNKRYLKRDETGKVIEKPEDMFMRVAQTVGSNESNYKKSKTAVAATVAEYYKAMTEFRFLPNSPTLMNAGRELGQLSACFVLPIGDSIEEIFEAIKYTALIHKSGGGTGFSFGRLRPSDDLVMSTMGVASGPESFMRIFNAATEEIKQGGTRRGANMAILPIIHPDSPKFIRCKDDGTKLNNFNISVGITDEFMAALDREDDTFWTINPRDGKKVKQLHARELFDDIIKQAHKNGEPGIIFIDRMNAGNPTPHLGDYEATNPCGEQILLPYESCNLGSVNLAKMVTADGKVNWVLLKETVRTAVGFLDNVIDKNKYPLPQIEEITKGNRKIGLGVMGWADMLVLMGIGYSTEEARELGKSIMKFISEEADNKSIELAAERGVYPNWKGSAHEKKGIKQRNATTTTIAPTGTISVIANSSSGVEPLFAVSYVRTVMDKTKLIEVNEYFEETAKKHDFYSADLMEQIAEHGSVHGIAGVPQKWQDVFQTAHDVSPTEHVLMQAAFQAHTDNAVSKTVNLPSDATEDDVRNVYLLAYKSGCKGTTIYRDGSRDEQVLSTGKTGKEVPKEVAEVKVEVVETGKKEKRERPKALKGYTVGLNTGCGPLYVTINSDENGLFELFTTMGKAGGCAGAQCEAIGRLVSLAWRSGVSGKEIIKQLQGISCHLPQGFGENRVTSCSDAVAKAIIECLELHGEEMVGIAKKNASNRGACPECGGVMEHEGGCCVCRVCAYSECQ